MSNSNKGDNPPTNQRASQLPPINLHDTLLTLEELSLTVMAAAASLVDEATSGNTDGL